MQVDDFRRDLPVSRGQYRAIAEALCDRIGEARPATRFDATELLVRLAADAAAGSDSSPAPAEF